ncbi:MAG: glycosyltransferase, partial [Gemmatimonadales bacterium]
MLTLLVVVHAYILLTVLANVAWLRRQGTAPTAPDALPSLTVLVPARNEEANLRRLLPSLLAQRYPDAEFLVYDDASDDGTAEVVRRHADPRLRLLCGDGPPPGWVGKVYALAEASKEATGDVLLFLDADAELLHPDALAKLVARWSALPAPSVCTGLPRLVGGGLLIVSAIPFTFLAAGPAALLARFRLSLAAVLNGQCWMVAREVYERWQPHRAHPDAVVEDLAIGRYLHRRGVTVAMFDLQDDVAVRMYGSFGEAWRG